MNKLLIITLLLAAFSTAFDENNWYQQINGYDNLLNSHSICETLVWPDSSVHNLDAATEEDGVTTLNWFDMSPDNMQFVLSHAYDSPIGGNTQWWEQGNNIVWPRTQNQWRDHPSNSDKIAGFILHGRQVSMGISEGQYTNNSHINKVCRVVEKYKAGCISGKQ